LYLPRWAVAATVNVDRGPPSSRRRSPMTGPRVCLGSDRLV
jgi:hypothetical protein